MQWPAVVAVLLVMLDILVFAIDVKAGFLVFCFTAAYWVLMSVLMLRYRPFVLREMIAFASQYSQIQKGMLKNFSIPYAVLDTDGRVLWMNDAFCDVTGKDSRYRKNISNLFPEIDASALPCKKEETDVQIFYNENDYQAHLQKLSMGDLNEEVSIVDIPQEGNYLIALYLFDNTELNYYIRQNQEQKMVAGLIYLDNYDEVLESVEEVRRSLLLALIDRKISKYVANLDGITKKLEKDKYFVVLKYKSLEELEANRFSLLEEVKTVNIGNEMKVTLSIGIGVNGSTYAQNYEFSRIAIELALGRGGDQAVVKDNDKISYYGGKSQQMEKSTRVKARVKAHALREFIGSHEDVVIMGHKITDIDSFGAAVGVWRAARILDKKAHIVLGDINGSIRQWVNLFLNDKEYPEDMFVTHEQARKIVDHDTVVVVVDTNRPSMTECSEILNQTRTIVVLDHHRQSSEVIKNAVLSYIEPYASSACEMIAEILQCFQFFHSCSIGWCFCCFVCFLERCPACTCIRSICISCFINTFYAAVIYRFIQCFLSFCYFLFFIQNLMDMEFACSGKTIASLFCNKFDISCINCVEFCGLFFCIRCPYTICYNLCPVIIFCFLDIQIIACDISVCSAGLSWNISQFVDLIFFSHIYGKGCRKCFYGW